ncbi:MAG: DEAD/DEAH box helicase [Eggerthella lenta]
MSDGRATVSGIMFHCSDIESLMRTDSVVNAAFEVQIDEWRGRKSVKAMLQSLAPARTCGALEACLNPENLSFVADLYATSDAELCANAPHRPEDVEAYEAARAANRACWERKAAEDPAALEQAVVRAIIGDKPLHDAQREILAHLRAGRSTLGIMATGRGKSLTFQGTLPRARRTRGQPVVYPLRALIADQAFHLREALDAFGIGVITLTARARSTSAARAFAPADGTYDIVPTTLEFLGTLTSSRPGRASSWWTRHHIGLAKRGQRPTPPSAPPLRSWLCPGGQAPGAGGATADDEVAAAIKREPLVDACVYDPASRSNPRWTTSAIKNATTTWRIIASGGKTVIELREQSVAVARSGASGRPAGRSWLHRPARAERKRIEAVPHRRAVGAGGHVRFRRGVDIPTSATWCRTTCRSTRSVRPDERPGGPRRQPAHPPTVQPRRLLAQRAHPARHDADHDARPRCTAACAVVAREGECFFTMGNADLAAACTDASLSAPAWQVRRGGVSRAGLSRRTPRRADGMARSIHVVETQDKVELTTAYATVKVWGARCSTRSGTGR